MIRKLSIGLLALSMIDPLPLYGKQQHRKHTPLWDTNSDSKRLKRYSMSKGEVDAFLWVEQHLFECLVKNRVDVPLAKARTEIATARAFGIEPSNWAKRDIGIFVETNRAWEAKKADVESRLRAAQEHSREVEGDLIRRHGNDVDPGKLAAMYWFSSARDQKPDNLYYPYAVAIDAERKIELEREQLYKQFNKTTPEEKLGGAIAMLLVMAMLDSAAGDAGLTAEAEAALSELGEAEAALAVAESEVASTSIMNARSILIASEESAAALAAVEQARAALVAGEIERAAAAVADAQAELSARLQVNPAAVLALASVDKSIAKLAAAEAADAEIGIKEKAKLDLFEYAATHQGDVSRLLAADLKLAVDYAARYRAFVAKGTPVPSTTGSNKSIREGRRHREH